MKELSPQEAGRWFEAAPKQIQDFLANDELSRKIDALGDAYKLHVDVVGMLQMLTSYMLIGYISPDQFAEELHQAGVSTEMTQMLVAAINQQIFIPLQKKMRGEEDVQVPAPQPRPQVASVPSYAAAAPMAAPAPAPAPVSPSVAQTPAPVTPPAPRPTQPVPSARPMQQAPQNPGISSPLPPKLTLPNMGGPANNIPDLKKIVPLPTNLPGQTPEPRPTPPAPSPAPSSAVPKPPPKSYSVDPYREPLDDSK